MELDIQGLAMEVVEGKKCTENNMNCDRDVCIGYDHEETQMEIHCIQWRIVKNFSDRVEILTMITR